MTVAAKLWQKKIEKNAALMCLKLQLLWLIKTRVEKKSFSSWITKTKWTVRRPTGWPTTPRGPRTPGAAGKTGSTGYEPWKPSFWRARWTPTRPSVSRRKPFSTFWCQFNKTCFPSSLTTRPDKLEGLPLETLSSWVLEFEGKARANPIRGSFRCLLLG